jgi:hypothetical protein
MYYNVFRTSNKKPAETSRFFLTCRKPRLGDKFF